MTKERKGLFLSVMILLAVIVSLALLPTLSAADSHESDVEIEGMVKATAKDDAGKATAVSIEAGDAEYDVMLDDQGTALLEKVGTKVKAKGKVVEKEGKKMMTVTETEDVP